MNTDISFEEIRKIALELGWDDVGTTPAKISEEDIASYREWIRSGSHAELHYMENEVRCYPEKFLPGAKTAIIFVSYYKQEPLPFRRDAGLVAAYARGRDYHHIHKKRLKKFITWLEERAQAKGIARGFSDSSPVLEKALAVKAGLGWFGKNTLLIHRRFGTFILLSGVFTTLEISHTVEEMRLPKCGSCTRCLDACPTQALTAPYKLEAAKCLAYHLIESKKDIPEDIQKKNPGYVFGCDICQDVCPHNVRKKTTENPDFTPTPEHKKYLTLSHLEQFERQPELLFGTPLQRKKIPGLRQNLASLNKDDLNI